MSCDEDDDVWEEEPEPVIEVRKLDIEVNEIKMEQLISIKEAMTICLDRKLDKLNLLLKQMNVYSIDGNLIVNDRYNTALNFIKTVEAFGMDIKKIEGIGFRGNTYIIGDKITLLLNVLGQNYSSDIVDIQNMPSNIDVNELRNELFKYNLYDDKFIKYMREILKTGKVTIEGTETLIDGVSQGIESNYTAVTKELKNYLSDIKKQVCANNKELQHGTTEILYERARQMGYAVEKSENGDEVQLVLVRLD